MSPYDYKFSVRITYHSGRLEHLRRRDTRDGAERAADVFKNCPSVKSIEIAKVT